MKILFATSEAGPFMRTGGLGDVGQALPLALTKEKQDVRVIMPLYDGIKDIYRQTMQFLGSKVVTLGWRQQYAGVFFYEYEGVKYYFIDNEYYFKRFGIYGHYDDGERFSFFSRAVLDVLTLIDFTPDVIHCNDWQTGLIPVYLDAFYRGDERYANIRTVMTIHNIEFQGEMDKSCISEVFGIPASHASIVEYNNNANMLKAGIEASHAVTTVSRTYAEEILNPYFAYGLEDILAKRRYKIRGILNGIDTDVYNPAKDSALFAKYTLKTVAKKAADKKGLQELVNLPVSADKPLIGMVTRLTNQKGMDLVMEVIEEILSMDLQMVILGTGDWKYETALNELSRRYGNKLLKRHREQDLRRQRYVPYAEQIRAVRIKSAYRDALRFGTHSPRNGRLKGHRTGVQPRYPRRQRIYFQDLQRLRYARRYKESGRHLLQQGRVGVDSKQRYERRLQLESVRKRVRKTL